MEVGRRSARRKPAAPTSTAPAITNASDGSHAPARSRNPVILDGSVMPDTMRPTPKRRPVRNEVSAGTASSRNQVANDENGDEPRGHESSGRGERARRQPGDAAHAVPARAARPVAGADPHQQPRQGHQREAGLDSRGRKAREQPVDSRSCEQSYHEGDPPADVTPRGPQQPAEYSADAGDAPVEQHERRHGNADEQPAGERAPGGEMRPVDRHG